METIATPPTTYPAFRNRAGQWVCNCLHCGKQTVNKTTATCSACKRRSTCPQCGRRTAEHGTGFCRECYKKSGRHRERGTADPTPEEIVVLAAEARRLFSDVGRFPRGQSMFNVLVDFVGDSDAEDDLEKNLRSHIRDNLRRSRTRRYDIATLLKNGIEECFTLDGSWSNDRDDWRQRSGSGVDAEGFSTAYVANGGFGRLAG